MTRVTKEPSGELMWRVGLRGLRDRIRTKPQQRARATVTVLSQKLKTQVSVDEPWTLFWGN